jgi:NAD(P)-dependent dehydrogenase (short-subunit alcohol dehydrogenase family)
MKSLEGRKALVVAGAKGIAKACVERFAAAGAEVCFSDINAQAGFALAEKLQEAGYKASFFVSDAGDSKQVRELVKSAIDTMGTIDVLLNSAGVATPQDLLDITEEEYDRTLNVNLKSAFVASQEVARHLLANKSTGVIINMSSVNSVMTIPSILVYNVSKGGINQLTRNMAVTLAPHGIRVNAIGPGTIETELVRSTVLSSEEAMAKIMSRTPMGRLGQPEEIASIAVFLASDESSYITGQIIFADGGRMGLNYTC